MRLSPRRILLPGLLLVAAFAGWAVQRAATNPADIEGFLWPQPESLASFALQDHTGGVFDRTSIEGRWTLWYFGYTHCPDACPTALTQMRGIEGALLEQGVNAEEMQYVFVSIDPKRDTPTHLADYVPFFSNALIGATGDDAQLKALARQLGVLYSLDEPDENGDYLVDHSTYLFLTDPNARWVGLFRPEVDVSELAERVLAIRREISSS